MLYLPLDTEDVMTHGQLLATYRTARGLEQTAVSQLLADSASSPWVISRLENDRTSRPSPHRERQIALGLRLTYRQYTSLLRAADVDLTPQEVVAMRVQVAPLLSALTAPAFIADSRGTLWAVNSAFQQRFAPLDVPGSPQASGSQGISYFGLLFSQHSGLRQAFEPTEWHMFARTQLSRFWLTTRRLIQDAWGGRPQWLDDQLALLSQLPDRDGALFQEVWREAQEDEDAAGPSAAEGEFLPPGLAAPLHFHRAQSAFVLATPLTDTRFGFRAIYEDPA